MRTQGQFHSSIWICAQAGTRVVCLVSVGVGDERKIWPTWTAVEAQGKTSQMGT